MAQTVAYFYRLSTPGLDGQPLVAYHWHPAVEGISYPHIHVSGGPPEIRRLHIAVPHCTLRHVLAFAMRDFAVMPVHDGWEPVLAAAGDAMRQSMEWASEV